MKRTRTALFGIGILFIFVMMFSACKKEKKESTQNDAASQTSTIISQYQVSQYGVTFHFESDAQTGQFANGDYWVLGPVTIIRITPDFVSGDNGWEVNPMPSRFQAFDATCSGYDASRMPSLPYLAQPGETIIKAISGGGPSNTCIDSVTSLTVVAEPPPGNGAAVFRPPYVGDEKPYYAVNDLQIHLLASLDPVNNTPSLDWIANRFAPVQLDHCMGALGRDIHPVDYMPDYAPDMAVDHNEAALRLMLNDSIDAKEQALINFVQYGIDLYHMVINGQTWPGGGGYTPGKKMPLTFAAVMLNNYDMKTWIRNNVGHFNEDYATYYGEGGVALFGIENGPVRTAADPYHYIDGGEVPGDSYQFCCLSQPYKGAALVAYLVPEMIEIWNHPALFDYVDRWVTFGVWTQPDPYNRFPELHGTQPDGGYRRSRFVDAMWDAYR